MPLQTEQASAKMQAYQVVAHGEPLVCKEVPKPTPGPYEVLAKTIVTGVCHTDIHVIDGDWGALALPLTPGHEGVGVVESVGSEVTTFKVGDRIGVPWLGLSCGECNLCKDGRENLCQAQKQTGFIRDGSFAEYFLADVRYGAKIPDNISDSDAAPILCAGVTAYKALRMAAVSKGSRVVIAGACGGLGHMAVQFAKGMGLEVIALDVFDEKKIEMVKGCGADYTVDLKSEVPVVDQMKAVSDASHPINAAVIFAPALSAVSDAVNYVAPGGTIVCVGLPKGKFEIDVVTFILKELRLQGSIVGTKRDLEEALRLVSEGKVKAHVEVRNVRTLNDVLDEMKKGAIRGRIVLEMAGCSKEVDQA